MQQFIYVIAFVLIVALIFCFYLFNRMRKSMNREYLLNQQLGLTLDRKNHMAKELRQKELVTREIEMQMKYQAAILEQRRQISDDMHDEISSSLAALKFYIADLQNTPANTASATVLNDIAAEVNAIYDRTRQYMLSLRQNNTSFRCSLISFLQDIAQKMHDKKLMNIKLQVDEEGVRKNLSIMQHDQLYHIIKESITNTIKHADATRLVIDISFQGGYCFFSVADNGKGFVESKALYGIGIESIKCRTKKIKGIVTITSSAAGTMVMGNFPAEE